MFNFNDKVVNGQQVEWEILWILQIWFFIFARIQQDLLLEKIFVWMMACKEYDLSWRPWLVIKYIDDWNVTMMETKKWIKEREKKKVAFICVHNSCRSQIAEALGKHLASDVFDSYSAGTETKSHINQDAVRIMKELYAIDMEQTQYSKRLVDIPNPDIAISMGCNVSCPFIGREFDDNWRLEDPTGKSDEEFKKIIQLIENQILELKEKLLQIFGDSNDQIKIFQGG